MSADFCKILPTFNEPALVAADYKRWHLSMHAKLHLAALHLTLCWLDFLLRVSFFPPPLLARFPYFFVRFSVTRLTALPLRSTNFACVREEFKENVYICIRSFKFAELLQTFCELLFLFSANLPYRSLCTLYVQARVILIKLGAEL